VDDCLRFVAPEPFLAIPEIKTIPVWVTLKKIFNILYFIPGISHIASGLGAPMATHKPRLDPTLMGEERNLEVELSNAFPPRIAAENKTGFICMVDVEYAWLPSKCVRCGQLGHKVKCCLQSGSYLIVVANTTAKALVFDDIVLDDIDVCTKVITTKKAPLAQVNSAPVSKSTSKKASPYAQVDSISAPVTEEHSNVHLESERLIEPDIGSNKFASWALPKEEVDLSESDKESDKESDETDFMTPSGKRIL
jgi:hypothetical protein